MSARAGMTRQVALGTAVAAFIAVVGSGAVSIGLTRSSYDAAARDVLGREATLVAANLEGVPAGRQQNRPVLRMLRAARVQVVRVRANGAVQGGTAVDPRDAAAAAAGQSVSAVRRLNGNRYFVEVQPVGGDGGVLLLQRSSVARAVNQRVLRRFGLALLLGLLAAAGVGALLARRLTQPLVRAAQGAHRLAAGERAVRLSEDGPAEVAELAVSLNVLAAALAASEGRQRDFLLSISHELRTPLTAIGGFAEAIADRVTTGEEAAAAGATIQAEAARMQRLVADLLDLARLGADDFRLELTPVDLTALLSDAATVWSQRCAAVGVLHAVELPGDPVWVSSDPGRLRQVVDGLAENALRVTPSGRPIIFALHPDGTGRGAVVEVRDGGPGLRPDDLAVAFDRSVLYERYRGVRRVGTGLGLALVGGLVSRLGGVARAGHAPEGGAAFTVTLPLLRPVAARR